MRYHRVTLLGLALVAGIASPSCGADRATTEGNRLVYRDAGQTLTIQAWGRDSLRVRCTPDGGGQTSDWALDIPLEKEGKQEEFLNVAREYQRRGLPLSVLVIDFLHWDITGNWRLDPRSWPDPMAMVKEMDEMGVRIMISPWTLVDEKSDNFAYMKEHGLFTGSVGGKKDTVEFFGPKYQYDPTNPEAAKYLWRQWKKNYVDLGIRTFWLDPCDEFHEIRDYD